jgi:NADH-quinone oxidoreductase subunit M
MILIVMLLILLLGGILAGVVSQWSTMLSRCIALIATAIDLVIICVLWIQHDTSAQNNNWIIDFNTPWIPTFGIGFHLAMDGLSMLMLVLTFFLGVFAVLISWNEIQFRVGFFHFNLLWVLGGITGVFLTMDLFLFYFFWEVMLIPMYFLIGIWGHENRQYAAYKFFIFTQASGLLMLISILGLFFIHASSSGIYTFDYFDLLGTTLSPGTARWIMMGFLAAFIVKLPVVPFHTWLPDAHTEAPTAGSLILAGLLLKTGAYGLLRFVIPLFPAQAAEIAPVAMGLGAIGIVYGAIQAFAQTDFKRLVAYTSVSHMGFIMLGVFSFNAVALQGVVMQMITHGISTGALFIIAGALYERIHTRDIQSMGGLWSRVPFMGTIAMVFVMASLGLPGLGNFVAEIMTLLGAWSANHLFTIIATIGVVLATAYSLRIMQKIFLGKGHGAHSMVDLSLREKAVMIPLALTIILLGFFPQPVLDTSAATVDSVLKHDFTPPSKESTDILTSQKPTDTSSGKGAQHE